MKIPPVGAELFHADGQTDAILRTRLKSNACLERRCKLNTAIFATSLILLLPPLNIYCLGIQRYNTLSSLGQNRRRQSWPALCRRLRHGRGNIGWSDLDQLSQWSEHSVSLIKLPNAISDTEKFVVLTECTQHTYLLTYLFTPWNRVLLKKPTGPELVKKFPTLYGTRRFITAVTTARQLSLSWFSSIQSTPPHPTSWKSILILSSHLRLGLPSSLFPSGFSTKTLYTLSSPHTCYMPRPSHSYLFYHPNSMGWKVQVIKLLIM